MAGDICEIVKLCVAYIVWPPPKNEAINTSVSAEKIAENPPFAGNSVAIFARSACASIAFALGPVERPEWSQGEAPDK